MKLPRFYIALKRWWQRRTRGWDDSELWSLDYTIIAFVYPRLKAFRERPPGSVPFHPTELGSDGNPRALKSDEWDAILGEMLEGFKLAVEDDGYPLIGDDQTKLERSLDLFHEWFFSLWI